jgi:phytoene synthase
MRRDARPAPFRDLDDLVERYVYGSAVVVGYFLAHVYGATTPGDADRALRASRALGIGLQLTNFLRDVREDRRRGRLYLPLADLAAEGLDERRVDEPSSAEALARVVRNVARRAEAFYAEAARDLDAFSPDSRIAIRACIDVYGALNRRILASPDPLARRESVPMSEKWRALPAAKWWRIPAAYLFE